MRSRLINTDAFSEKLRSRAIDIPNNRVLISNFYGSQQEIDLTEPANCSGFGRIRHFSLSRNTNWPQNPLPIEPARRALNLPAQDYIDAQVFQNAACNWRCWYCFVDFKLLSADRNQSAFLSARELLNLYEKEDKRLPMIDLSGGQPDLVPEWVPWMMRELQDRGLSDTVYLWSDDNLSNDYFWQFLSRKDIDLISTYKNYGKVCCFKGFDATSFSFNTKADPELFDRQFSLMERLLSTQIDIYCYATFTTPENREIRGSMCKFIDKLQQLDHNLPLRTIPLEIKAFTPVKDRMNAVTREAIAHQYIAVDAWRYELSNRYSAAELNKNISEVSLAKC